MKRPSSRLGLMIVVAVGAVVLAATAAARTTASQPIIIGWAFDSKGAMAPFDDPALAAAKLRVNQLNARGRRPRPQAADHDVRHAGQQARDRQGVRAEADRPGRERHLHDLRRRSRGAGRAGGDQPRHPGRRAVHRHRPDGAEALRHEGAARLQLRQRRPGRRLGDGAVRVGPRLADRVARHRHA